MYPISVINLNLIPIFQREQAMKGFQQTVFAILIFLICSALIRTSCVHAGSTDIKIWTYYKFGPFVTESRNTSVKKGMTYDLAKLLSKKSRGKYRFIPSVFPRKRLDKFIDEGQQAVVVFVNPRWMQDKAKTKYLWTSSILSDRNEIASRMSGKSPNRIVYSDIHSLKGLVLGGVTGRRYPGIDEAVKLGEIVRFNVTGEDQNLKKLVSGRIDFMTSPHSMLKYLIRKLDLENQVYFSPTPLFTSTRHFMVTRDLIEEYEFLDNFTLGADSDPDWINIKRKYGL